MAASPSMSAAWPGWRISADLISCSWPSRMAATALQPWSAATRTGRNFLPHQELITISGGSARSRRHRRRFRISPARCLRRSATHRPAPAATRTSRARRPCRGARAAAHRPAVSGPRPPGPAQPWYRRVLGEPHLLFRELLVDDSAHRRPRRSLAKRKPPLEEGAAAARSGGPARLYDAHRSARW